MTTSPATSAETPGRGPSAPPPTARGAGPEAKIRSRDLNLHYGTFQALINVNIAIKPRWITAIIGFIGGAICGLPWLLSLYMGWLGFSQIGAGKDPHVLLVAPKGFQA